MALHSIRGPVRYLLERDRNPRFPCISPERLRNSSSATQPRLILCWRLFHAPKHFTEPLAGQGRPELIKISSGFHHYKLRPTGDRLWVALVHIFYATWLELG
jgi:hypothetical protein